MKNLMVTLFAIVVATTPVSAYLVLDYMPNYTLKQFIPAPDGTRKISTLNDEDSFSYNAEWTFDEKGHLVKRMQEGTYVGWGSEEYYFWDEQGRLLSSKAEWHGSDVSFDHYNTSYVLDDKGRVVKEINEHTFSCPPDYIHQPSNPSTVTYTYNDKGQIVRTTVVTEYIEPDTKKKEDVVQVVTFEYDSDGNVVKAVYKADDHTFTEEMTYATQGPHKGRLIKVVSHTEDFDGNPEIAEMNFGYITRGNILSACIYDGGVTTFSNEDNYYDDISSPLLACNTKGEPLIDFMFKFTTDSLFCLDRSKGFVKCVNPTSVNKIMMDYARNTTPDTILKTGINLGYYGKPEEYDLYAHPEDSDGCQMCLWEILNPDIAVLHIEHLKQGDVKESEDAYVFARVDSKWRLAGVTPVPVK